MDNAANKEAWIETVRTAMDAGLEHTLPRRKAVSKAEVSLKNETQLVLSRKTFSMPDTSHIRWKE